jgi:hypothetical protein
MSLIRESGRDFRLNICFAALIIGGLPMIFGGTYISLAGLAVAAMALLLGWFFVTCPNCGSKWLLHFMRTSTIGKWLEDLYKMEQCPSCGYEHET